MILNSKIIRYQLTVTNLVGRKNVNVAKETFLEMVWLQCSGRLGCMDGVCVWVIVCVCLCVCVFGVTYH